MLSDDQMELNELNEKYRNPAFHTKIKGVSIGNRQGSLKFLEKGQKLFYLLEDDNPIDPNAIHVYADEAHTIDLGYISKLIVPDLRKFLKHNIGFEFYATEVTGLDKPTQGCNVLIVLKR